MKKETNIILGKRPLATNISERVMLRKHAIRLMKSKKWTISRLYSDTIKNASAYSKNLKIQIFKMYREYEKQTEVP